MSEREELWGVPEIAAAFGVRRETAHRWVKRADFPAPLARLRMGSVYDAVQVRTWRRRQVKARQKRAMTPARTAGYDGGRVADDE